MSSVNHSTFVIRRSTFGVRGSAFTLIELLVVIMIIAVLMGLAFLSSKVSRTR